MVNEVLENTPHIQDPDLGPEKKVVHYKDILIDSLKVGQQAWVVPVDHPNSPLNGFWAHTSQVQNIGTADTFETLNTIYKRA